MTQFFISDPLDIFQRKEVLLLMTGHLLENFRESVLNVWALAWCTFLYTLRLTEYTTPEKSEVSESFLNKKTDIFKNCRKYTVWFSWLNLRTVKLLLVYQFAMKVLSYSSKTLYDLLQMSMKCGYASTLMKIRLSFAVGIVE